MAQSDVKLWQRWRERREEAAFETLLARHAPYVRGLARRVSGNDADAEDLTQDAFVSLAETDSSRPAEVGLRAFLGREVTLTARTLRRVRRARRRRERLAARPDERDEDPSRRCDAEAILALLPREQRTAATLRFLHGLSYAEIARILDTSEPGARMRVHRALQRLRAELGPGALALLGFLGTGRTATAAVAGAGGWALVTATAKKLVVLLLLLACGMTVAVWPRAQRAAPREITESAAAPAPETRPAERQPRVSAPQAAPTGRIRFRDGTPLRRARIRASKKGGALVTDEDGRFAGAAGTFRLLLGRGTWVTIGALVNGELVVERGVPLEGGVFVRATGEPVADARLRLRRRGFPEAGGPTQAEDAAARTDRDGAFSLPHLLPGHYDVTVEGGEGLAPLVTAVEVKPAHAPLRLLLGPGREWEIRLANLPEKLRATRLRVIGVPEQRTWRREIDDGVVRIPAPPPGEYRLELRAADPRSGFPTVVRRIRVTEAAEPFEIDFPRGGLSGRLLDAAGAPAGERELVLEATGARTVTGADGRFAFATAPEGATRIGLRGDGTTYLRDVDVPAAGLAEVEVRIVGTATVRVEPRAGKARFCRVRLWQEERLIAAAFVKPGDTATLRHLVAGRYRLELSANSGPAQERTLDIARGQAIDLGTVPLPSFPRVPVTVNLPEGANLPTHLLAIRADERGHGVVWLNGTKQGYLTGLPAGTHRLFFIAPGFRRLDLEVTVAAGAKKLTLDLVSSAE